MPFVDHDLAARPATLYAGASMRPYGTPSRPLLWRNELAAVPDLRLESRSVRDSGLLVDVVDPVDLFGLGFDRGQVQVDYDRV